MRVVVNSPMSTSVMHMNSSMVKGIRKSFLVLYLI